MPDRLDWRHVQRIARIMRELDPMVEYNPLLPKASKYKWSKVPPRGAGNRRFIFNELRLIKESDPAKYDAIRNWYYRVHDLVDELSAEGAVITRWAADNGKLFDLILFDEDEFDIHKSMRASIITATEQASTIGMAIEMLDGDGQVLPRHGKFTDPHYIDDIVNWYESTKGIDLSTPHIRGAPVPEELPDAIHINVAGEDVPWTFSRVGLHYGVTPHGEILEIQRLNNRLHVREISYDTHMIGAKRAVDPIVVTTAKQRSMARLAVLQKKRDELFNSGKRATRKYKNLEKELAFLRQRTNKLLTLERNVINRETVIKDISPFSPIHGGPPNTLQGTRAVEEQYWGIRTGPGGTDDGLWGWNQPLGPNDPGPVDPKNPNMPPGTLEDDKAQWGKTWSPGDDSDFTDPNDKPPWESRRQPAFAQPDDPYYKNGPVNRRRIITPEHEHVYAGGTMPQYREGLDYSERSTIKPLAMGSGPDGDEYNMFNGGAGGNKVGGGGPTPGGEGFGRGNGGQPPSKGFGGGAFSDDEVPKRMRIIIAQEFGIELPENWHIKAMTADSIGEAKRAVGLISDPNMEQRWIREAFDEMLKFPEGTTSRIIRDSNILSTEDLDRLKLKLDLVVEHNMHTYDVTRFVDSLDDTQMYAAREVLQTKGLKAFQETAGNFVLGVKEDPLRETLELIGNLDKQTRDAIHSVVQVNYPEAPDKLEKAAVEYYQVHHPDYVSRQYDMGLRNDGTRLVSIPEEPLKPGKIHPGSAMPGKTVRPERNWASVQARMANTRNAIRGGRAANASDAEILAEVLKQEFRPIMNEGKFTTFKEFASKIIDDIGLENTLEALHMIDVERKARFSLQNIAALNKHVFRFPDGGTSFEKYRLEQVLQNPGDFLKRQPPVPVQIFDELGGSITPASLEKKYGHVVDADFIKNLPGAPDPDIFAVRPMEIVGEKFNIVGLSDRVDELGGKQIDTIVRDLDIAGKDAVYKKRINKLNEVLLNDILVRQIALEQYLVQHFDDFTPEQITRLGFINGDFDALTHKLPNALTTAEGVAYDTASKYGVVEPIEGTAKAAAVNATDLQRKSPFGIPQYQKTSLLEGPPKGYPTWQAFSKEVDLIGKKLGVDQLSLTDIPEWTNSATFASTRKQVAKTGDKLVFVSDKGVHNTFFAGSSSILSDIRDARAGKFVENVTPNSIMNLDGTEMVRLGDEAVSYHKAIDAFKTPGRTFITPQWATHLEYGAIHDLGTGPLAKPRAGEVYGIKMADIFDGNELEIQAKIQAAQIRRFEDVNAGNQVGRRVVPSRVSNPVIAPARGTSKTRTGFFQVLEEMIGGAFGTQFGGLNAYEILGANAWDSTTDLVKKATRTIGDLVDNIKEAALDAIKHMELDAVMRAFEKVASNPASRVAYDALVIEANRLKNKFSNMTLEQKIAESKDIRAQGPTKTKGITPKSWVEFQEHQTSVTKLIQEGLEGKSTTVLQQGKTFLIGDKRLSTIKEGGVFGIGGKSREVRKTDIWKHLDRELVSDVAKRFAKKSDTGLGNISAGKFAATSIIGEIAGEFILWAAFSPDASRFDESAKIGAQSERDLSVYHAIELIAGSEGYDGVRHTPLASRGEIEALAEQLGAKELNNLANKYGAMLSEGRAQVAKKRLENDWIEKHGSTEDMPDFSTGSANLAMQDKLFGARTPSFNGAYSANLGDWQEEWLNSAYNSHVEVRGDRYTLTQLLEMHATLRTVADNLKSGMSPKDATQHTNVPRVMGWDTYDYTKEAEGGSKMKRSLAQGLRVGIAALDPLGQLGASLVGGVFDMLQGQDKNYAEANIGSRTIVQRNIFHQDPKNLQGFERELYDFRKAIFDDGKSAWEAAKSIWGDADGPTFTKEMFMTGGLESAWEKKVQDKDDRSLVIGLIVDLTETLGTKQHGEDFIKGIKGANRPTGGSYNYKEDDWYLLAPDGFNRERHRKLYAAHPEVYELKGIASQRESYYHGKERSGFDSFQANKRMMVWMEKYWDIKATDVVSDERLAATINKYTSNKDASPLDALKIALDNFAYGTSKGKQKAGDKLIESLTYGDTDRFHQYDKKTVDGVWYMLKETAKADGMVAAWRALLEWQFVEANVWRSMLADPDDPRNVGIAEGIAKAFDLTKKGANVDRRIVEVAAIFSHIKQKIFAQKIFKLFMLSKTYGISLTLLLAAVKYAHLNKLDEDKVLVLVVQQIMVERKMQIEREKAEWAEFRQRVKNGVKKLWRNTLRSYVEYMSKQKTVTAEDVMRYAVEQAERFTTETTTEIRPGSGRSVKDKPAPQVPEGQITRQDRPVTSTRTPNDRRKGADKPDPTKPRDMPHAPSVDGSPAGAAGNPHGRPVTPGDAPVENNEVKSGGHGQGEVTEGQDNGGIGVQLLDAAGRGLERVGRGLGEWLGFGRQSGPKTDKPADKPKAKDAEPPKIKPQQPVVHEQTQHVTVKKEDANKPNAAKVLKEVKKVAKTMGATQKRAYMTDEKKQAIAWKPVQQYIAPKGTPPKSTFIDNKEDQKTLQKFMKQNEKGFVARYKQTKEKYNTTQEQYQQQTSKLRELHSEREAAIKKGEEVPATLSLAIYRAEKDARKIAGQLDNLAKQINKTHEIYNESMDYVAEQHRLAQAKSDMYTGAPKKDKLTGQYATDPKTGKIKYKQGSIAQQKQDRKEGKRKGTWTSKDEKQFKDNEKKARDEYNQAIRDAYQAQREHDKTPGFREFEKELRRQEQEERYGPYRPKSGPGSRAGKKSNGHSFGCQCSSCKKLDDEIDKDQEEQEASPLTAEEMAKNGQDPSAPGSNPPPKDEPQDPVPTEEKFDPHNITPYLPAPFSNTPPGVLAAVEPLSFELGPTIVTYDATLDTAYWDGPVSAIRPGGSAGFTTLDTPMAHNVQDEDATEWAIDPDMSEPWIGVMPLTSDDFKPEETSAAGGGAAGEGKQGGGAKIVGGGAGSSAGDKEEEDNPGGGGGGKGKWRDVLMAYYGKGQDLMSEDGKGPPVTQTQLQMETLSDIGGPVAAPQQGPLGDVAGQRNGPPPSPMELLMSSIGGLPGGSVNYGPLGNVAKAAQGAAQTAAPAPHQDNTKTGGQPTQTTLNAGGATPPQQPPATPPPTAGTPSKIGEGDSTPPPSPLTPGGSVAIESTSSMAPQAGTLLAPGGATSIGAAPTPATVGKVLSPGDYYPTLMVPSIITPAASTVPATPGVTATRQPIDPLGFLRGRLTFGQMRQMYGDEYAFGKLYHDREWAREKALMTPGELEFYRDNGIDIEPKLTPPTPLHSVSTTQSVSV